MGFVEDHSDSLVEFAAIEGVEVAATIAGYTNKGEEQWEELVAIYGRESAGPMDIVEFVSALPEHEMGVMLMVAAAIEHERREKEKHERT